MELTYDLDFDGTVKRLTFNEGQDSDDNTVIIVEGAGRPFALKYNPITADYRFIGPIPILAQPLEETISAIILSATKNKTS